jgi:PAS domain S-box-containing protein
MTLPGTIPGRPSAATSPDKPFGPVVPGLRSQSLLKEQLWLFSIAVDQSPVSIVVTDPAGNIEYVNPRFEKTSGYTFEEVRGTSPRFLKSGYTSPEQYKQLWEVISTGQDWRGEFHNRRKDGALYWESATISPIRAETGEILHFVAIKEDITDRKRTEMELIAAKERAERSDRLKDAFISNMSHEIRTPLNVILGYTDLIEMELGNRISQGEGLYFQSITRAAKRLMRTVENILTISSMEVGEYSFEKRDLDLVAEAYHLFMEMRLLAIEKHLEIDFMNECGSAMIHVDPVTFNDALANLLDNAIKFTNEGGVTVRVYRTYGSACITISDTGVGISEEYLPRLFATFSQEDTGTTRRFDGLGLGMALTKKYIDINGATIDISSRKDVGTSVTVRFSEVQSEPSRPNTLRPAKAIPEGTPIL